MNLPPPRIDAIDGFQVVRDDLVPGGTKQRALAGWLPGLGAAEYVYASPAQGYAQIAIAHAAAAVGARATIFVASRRAPHPRTLAARAAGAKIVQVAPGYLSNVQAKARAYSAAVAARLLPFGLDVADFRRHLAAVARALPVAPAEVWSAAGSGTLVRALQDAWPSAAFHAVRVGRPPDVGRARLWTAPEAYEEAARFPPPFPSCNNYDAKVWRFVKAHARPGALFWNVAA